MAAKVTLSLQPSFAGEVRYLKASHFWQPATVLFYLCGTAPVVFLTPSAQRCQIQQRSYCNNLSRQMKERGFNEQ